MASLYPGAVDDATSLYVPADSSSAHSLQTTLAVNCLNTDVVLQLVATPASIGFPADHGIVSIEDEQIVFTGLSGSTLTGCLRGQFGTTAIGHLAGRSVRMAFVAGYVKSLQDAVRAVQIALGTTGAFNFAAANVKNAAIVQTLTAPYTVTAPGVAYDGQVLTVALTQDGTGSRAVTWGAGFVNPPTVEPAAGTLTVAQFVGIAGVWYLCGQPVVGLHG
jgi:hypothetical protein